MKKYTYTPGPWIAYDNGNGMRICPESVNDDLLPNFSATKNEIAFMKPTAGNNEWTDEMWEIQKANARLISMAPEMLEMIEKLVVSVTLPAIKYMELLKEADALVNKAKGE